MDRIAFLRSLSLFQDLGDEALRYLAAEARYRVFGIGDTVVYQGEPGSTCHIVVQGRLRVFVVGEDGREFSVRLFGPGEIVGEMALFEDLPRSASVEALEETQTLELDRDVLLGCLRRSPALALSLLRALSARLRYTTEEAEGLASLTVAERLMVRLRQLSGWCGTEVEGGIRITLPMNQQELATLVGTSRESVNRALVKLRQQGKVRLEDGWIVLLDEDSPSPTDEGSD
jgi:CRP/FNR family transcriptional regulator